MNNVLQAHMGLYPEYTGDLEPAEKVKIAFNSDDTFEFSFDLLRCSGFWSFRELWVCLWGGLIF